MQDVSHDSHQNRLTMFLQDRKTVVTIAKIVAMCGICWRQKTGLPNSDVPAARNEPPRFFPGRECHL